ncbi:MAG: HIRAN domain protein [Candidatus Accumulibacter adjunctus]|uniref:HIRAN domain protein n=1 Tax=Candidatus Accumulibacter adjunctus TaxID=1454001 RepID=A0A011PQ95_9PROT|nr:MAG: HIRAN domain protein [Candidatus Accumulibacter adjunctus]
MPLRRLERALALAIALALPVPSVRGGEAIRILVQSSPLAGSQYYAASALWSQIRTGDRLTLVREADNRHDRNAVRVDWNGQQLGYVPRAENRAVARALDAGERLEARVSRMRQDPDPWRRLEFEVFLLL